MLATITQTTFCRADGGFGGPKRETPPPHAIPDRKPDFTCDMPTRPEMALIYRLSGDWNPLHADPSFAKAFGFAKPILHGLCSYGFATRHAQRIWSEQQGYTFPLLSDFWPRGEVAKAYGVFNDALGCANRATFVLDAEGVVSSTFSSPDLGTPRAKAEYEDVRRVARETGHSVAVSEPAK